MEDKIVYQMPAVYDNIFELLDNIEEVSLLSLCDEYLREHHLSVDKYKDSEYDCWAIYCGKFPQRRFLAKFDTKKKAAEYLYEQWAMPYIQDDYYESLYNVYWTIAGMYDISIETVKSLVKWNEKRKIAQENRFFRYDYSHYRRVLTDPNPNKKDIERIKLTIDIDMKINGPFTRAFKRHFGIDILHLTPAGVADVLVLIRWFDYNSVRDGRVPTSLRD